VVNDKEVVEQRPVKIGADVNGMRVIEDGLKADDRVVVNGIQRARPGAR
jgi:multidrug efflux pump subunit AcrA (membrane-fusion protein)